MLKVGLIELTTCNDARTDNIRQNANHSFCKYRKHIIARQLESEISLHALLNRKHGIAQAFQGVFQLIKSFLRSILRRLSGSRRFHNNTHLGYIQTVDAICIDQAVDNYRQVIRAQFRDIYTAANDRVYGLALV